VECDVGELREVETIESFEERCELVLTQGRKLDGMNAAAVQHGQAEADEDGGGFHAGVANPPGGEDLLDFEEGVNDFSGDVQAGGVGEQERGVETVVDGDVDLAGAAAVGVDDEGG
jgi:hypothetical protein